MGDGHRRTPTHTSAYYPQLDDSQIEEFRALLDRGLHEDVPAPETLSSMYDEKRREILGCADQQKLNDLENAVNALERRPPNGDVPNRPTIVFDRQTLRRLIVVGNTVATIRNGTPCLLRLAALMDRCLSRDLYNRFRSDFFDLVETLIGISKDVTERTRKPYRLFAGAKVHPKLDAKVLQLEPLAQSRHWQSLLDVRSGKASILDPIPLEEARIAVKDKQGWQQTLDEVERNLEDADVQKRMAAAAVGDIPTINRHLENLRRLKFTDIERQTRARFPMHWRDDTVDKHVELIIYNSVYSALLGKDGSPLQLPGIAPYSLLIPEPGEHLLRNFHSPGLYLSAGPLADYQFVISGLKAKSLLLSGITSFTRRQSTFTFEHELQKKLTAHIHGQGMHAIAAITVPEAFRSGELGFSAVGKTMPVLIETTTRYALVELLKRIEGLFENYEQVVKDVGKQVIRGIIEAKVKAWAREWLIKKIGKKLIPVVNLVSLAIDVFDDEQTEMIRAMLGCVVMATKSQRQDDLTISSKILSKIAVEKVQQAVVKELVNRGGKLVGKASRSGAKSKGAAGRPKGSRPQAEAPTKPASPDPAHAAQPAPTADTPGAGRGRSDPTTRQGTADTSRPLAEQRQRPRQQQYQQQQTKRPSEADRGVARDATGAKAVRGKATGTAADEPAATAPVRAKGAEPETVRLAPGVYRRRGAQRQQKAPPPREGAPHEKADGARDIADTHRALTRRGRVDDRGTDPHLRPAQSRPASVAAARRAGVPSEVLGDGYVMTRADVGAAAPDRPVPRGRPAPRRLPAEGRAVSRSEVQNLEVRADLELTQRALEASGARMVDVRVNQTQTSTDGGRAGTNRPDVQLTILQADLNGRRVHIEYDRSPPTRALDHARRILANDPDAIVILKIIDYERPRPRRRRDDEPPPPSASLPPPPRPPPPPPPGPPSAPVE